MKKIDRNKLDSGEVSHVLIKSPHYGSSLNKAWNESTADQQALLIGGEALLWGFYVDNANRSPATW
ncbi:unnamed protein product [Trichobilharzia regenti]|nr:unnamed protein product [Trichobilharzia regenti]